jgi:hypothetical protein
MMSSPTQRTVSLSINKHRHDCGIDGSIPIVFAYDRVGHTLQAL